MSERFEEFWSNVPEKAMRTIRVRMLEALRQIGKPLSARQLVEVLDGDASMGEAAGHPSAPETVGEAEAVKGDADKVRPKEGEVDVFFRLDEDGSGEDG